MMGGMQDPAQDFIRYRVGFELRADIAPVVQDPVEGFALGRVDEAILVDGIYCGGFHLIFPFADGNGAPDQARPEKSSGRSSDCGAFPPDAFPARVCNPVVASGMCQAERRIQRWARYGFTPYSRFSPRVPGSPGPGAPDAEYRRERMGIRSAGARDYKCNPGNLNSLWPVVDSRRVI
jgi:hypothetical protein